MINRIFAHEDSKTQDRNSYWVWFIWGGFQLNTKPDWIWRALSSNGEIYIATGSLARGNTPSVPCVAPPGTDRGSLRSLITAIHMCLTLQPSYMYLVSPVQTPDCRYHQPPQSWGYKSPLVPDYPEDRFCPSSQGSVLIASQP